MSLFIDMFAVGDHLFYLSALKKVQLQQLWHVLTEINGIQHTQQLPAYWGQTKSISLKNSFHPQSYGPLQADSLRLSQVILTATTNN